MKKVWFSVILSIIITSQICIAQVVNIEKKRKGNEDGFAGVIGLGFYLIDNGKHISQFKNTIDLQYKKRSHTFILLNDLSLMTVDDDNIVNSGFQHFRYNYTLKDSSFITIEAFVQHQYNAAKLLEKRLLAGVGPRFRIINSNKVSCFIGLIGMYEYEQLTDSLRTKTELIRLGSYLSFNWDIAQNLSLNNITYYQPAFQRFTNYRISSETNFRLKITRSLSFEIGLQTNYDSNPPENVQNLFYYWENALSYEF